ncbi:hypothetical protein TRFO_34875 [Tritrichomonas foetus]|uniref:Uncharacterized protein n=1 Tax=Tritrichomonas foetus TaxID=1144522 RepID=A0A1J4JN28_9EUKA|nr:hypothetical protein TRFO_34875 [Tritrichomonas foetus]|eukprot:OHS98660.1 hypothetical protein TRFO_34875 [Tritrichomonas foetus]
MDFEESAFQIASSLYHQLKPDEEYISVLQNAVLFIKPFRSFFLYVICNVIFLIVYSFHFSAYSLVLLLFAIQSIPSHLYHDYLMKIYSCFNFKVNQEKYLISKPLPLDHLCCLVSIIMLEIHQCIVYYIQAVKKGELIDISVLTLIFSFTFYFLYKIGDAFFIWLVLHLISFIPIVLTKRISFNFTKFPVKLEKAILVRLRAQIVEEERLSFLHAHQAAINEGK